MRPPRARTEGLVIQELPEEILVFDQRRHKAHCLNRPTALVWKHCDGRTDRASLARLVERELGLSAAEAIVQLALEQLASRHLLEGNIDRVSAGQRRSRRELLRQLAAAAATLPVILTVTAPRANAAGSQPPPPPPPFCSNQPDGTSCGNGMRCCGKTCVTPVAVGQPCTFDCNCVGGTCAKVGNVFLCQ